MSYITRNLRQTATYWAPATPDGYGGTTFSSPVYIKVRWENKTEVFIDAQGRELGSSAKVFVDRTLVPAGYLFLGSSPSSDPTLVTDAREIRGLRDIPNLKNTESEKVVFL